MGQAAAGPCWIRCQTGASAGPAFATCTAERLLCAQVVWALGFNAARADNSADYFVAPSSASSSCSHDSGLNTLQGPLGRTEASRWLPAGGGLASDHPASVCQFAARVGAPVEQWWIQQYRANDAGTVRNPVNAYIAFQWLWTNAVSRAEGDFAEVRCSLCARLPVCPADAFVRTDNDRPR